MGKEKQQLPQSTNRVLVEGIVLENNLKVEEGERQVNDKKVKQKKVSGSLSIKTGEHESFEVKVFIWQNKVDGTESKKFSGFVTLANELVSVKDAGLEGASKVRVTDAQLNLNEYYGKDNNLKQFPEVFINAGAGFINRINEGEEFNPRAEFSDLDIVVSKIIEETDKEGDTTGNVILEGYVINYDGTVKPHDFIVLEDNGADYVMSEFENGVLVNICGQLVNIQEEIIKETPMGFGKPKIEKSYRNKRQKIVSSGSVYDTDIQEDKVINPELFKKALQNRELYLAELKSRADQPKSQKSFGTTPPKPSSSKPSVDISNMF